MNNPIADESNYDRKLREFAREVFDSGETRSGTIELTEKEAREDRELHARARRPVNRLCFSGYPGCNCKVGAWCLGAVVLIVVLTGVFV